MFVAVLMHVPPAFCANVSVAPLTVTPAPAVTVTTPAPRLMRTIFVPVANATDEFGGMVEVMAPVFEKLIAPPLSARTRVSEVEVTVLIVSALNAELSEAAVRVAPAVNETMLLLSARGR